MAAIARSSNKQTNIHSLCKLQPLCTCNFISACRCWSWKNTECDAIRIGVLGRCGPVADRQKKFDRINAAVLTGGLVDFDLEVEDLEGFSTWRQPNIYKHVVQENVDITIPSRELAWVVKDGWGTPFHLLMHEIHSEKKGFQQLADTQHYVFVAGIHFGS